MADLFLVWKCPKCGEEIEETFDTCWRCGTSRGGTPVEVPSAVEASPVPSRGGREPSQKAQPLLVRYKDAYRQANAITAFGSVVKMGAYLFAMIVAVGALPGV